MSYALIVILYPDYAAVVKLCSCEVHNCELLDLFDITLEHAERRVKGIQFVSPPLYI
jgi:hypothetical protein